MLPFFNVKSKPCPINWRLEFCSHCSLNVVSINNGKTQPCNVFSFKVRIYDRRALMLKVIKVDGRWRCFILNIIVILVVHSVHFFLRCIVSVLRRLRLTCWTIEACWRTSWISVRGGSLATLSWIEDCSPFRCLVRWAPFFFIICFNEVE